jgi:TfoX/Sxy family transcriptional regulator of competence genes
MAFSEQLSDRIREALAHIPDLEEKHMFGGACFMVDGKMCIGVLGDKMMCRVDPVQLDKLIDEPGCRPMSMGGKTMNGFVLVDEYGMETNEDFRRWIARCLEFNPRAKAAKKKGKP